MRIHELLDRPIVTLADGVRLGKVKGVEFDTDDGRLRYLHFAAEGRRADGVVPWSSVRSIGKDVLTIDSAVSVMDSIPAPEQVMLTSQFGDRPVITESGEKIGTISSYDIDETTGRIDSFNVSKAGLLGGLGAREVVIPYSAVRSFGRDAIIVSDAVGLEEAA